MTDIPKKRFSVINMHGGFPEHYVVDEMLTFEGLNDLTSKWTYEVLGKRRVRASEFFLSGAIPQAYRAAQDLPDTTDYVILKPLIEFRRQYAWVPYTGGLKEQE